MTYASFSDAKDGFKQDADRIRILSSGGPADSYTDANGRQVPSIQNKQAAWDQQINQAQDGILAQATAQAGAAAASATGATQALVQIKNTYYGWLAADPTTRPDGSPMQPGDRYFNAPGAVEKTYNGSMWTIPNVGAADLASSLASKGSALVAHNQSNSYPAGSVGGFLQNPLGILSAPDKLLTKQRVLVGVLRNSGSGWGFINTSNHSPTGFNVTNIQVVGNALRISYLFTASNVGTLLAVPDETFAPQGMLAGGSVGTTYTDLFMAAPLRFTVDCTTNSITTSDIFSGLITASSAGGITTVSHPSCTANYASVCAPLRRTNGVVSAIPTTGYAAQATYIEHNCPLGGLITYSGSAWSMVTDMDTSRSPVSFSWNSTDSRLVVTHAACMNGYTPQLTTRGSGPTARLSAIAGTVSRTTFSVEFYDTSGNKVTSPAAGTAFVWSRPGITKSNLVSDSFYAVDRGYALLDPAQLVSTTGNWWVYGVMEG